MNRAGTETWLMEVLRNVDRDKLRMDFLYHGSGESDYDSEIEELGSSILRCPNPKSVIAYTRALRELCRSYDIVHSHLHYFSGLVLREATAAGVDIRVAHAHTDTFNQESQVYRRVYVKLMMQLIHRYTTDGIGVSSAAASSLFGSNWEHDPRLRIIPCGIDLSVFSDTIDKRKARAEFGIPYDAVVFGHVGRFEDVKNHSFLIDIMKEIVRLEPRAYLMLVGDGNLREAVRKKVEDDGLQDRVVFTGVRADVHRLLQGCTDVFLFPSKYEGLGRVVVEAQAAGLPCVVSDRVPELQFEIGELVVRMSLSASARHWAEAAIAVITRRQNSCETLRLLRGTPLDLNVSIRSLLEMYESSLRRSGWSNISLI